MTVQSLIILLCFLAVNGFEYLLDYLNYRQLIKYGRTVPEVFAGLIDEKLLEKSSAYTQENMRFNLFSSLFDNAVLLLFVFFILNTYNNFFIKLQMPFIVHGIFFMLALILIKTLISIPFDLYEEFKIENKYGFNNMTIGLWISDFFKGILLTIVFMGTLLAGAFWLMETLPSIWWLAVWGFLFLFTMFTMYISPYVLEPLFNKFTPLGDEGLEADIKALTEKAGIHVNRVFKMDASKRSKHSNAYFSGIGRTKRIVIFDTLLNQMSKDELLAVLAHEAGHWKKKHILKQIIIFETVSLAGIYLAFILINSGWLGKAFGIEHNTIFSELMLLSFIASIATWPFGPIHNIVSRRFEREADDFASKLMGSGQPLASALKKLCKDNLSNLYPHPLYWKFHYSHPPALIRIKYLESSKKDCV